MPVQGVNLSEGTCDAIGVLFAKAFSRDARVVVASPLETKPLRDVGKTSAAIASELGAGRYVELSALRLGKKVQVGGIAYARGGAVLFRAETSAPGLNDMEAAIATLAHALAWDQPIPSGARPDGNPLGPEAAGDAPAAPGAPPDPDAWRRALGGKVGLVLPRAQGRSFSPSASAQFDGRFGPRSHFLELGGGVMVSLLDAYDPSSSIRVTGGFLELGGSYYLWAGSAALYVGAGLSPALWELRGSHSGSHVAATCGGYGQIGATVTRDARARIFVELRVTQILLAVANPVSDGTAYGSTLSDTYRPLLLALQAGVGF